MFFTVLWYKLNFNVQSFFFSQTINGKVQNLCKLAANRDYVECGCGAACAKHACKHGGTCLDNYNVYSCDCSKTPFYGYFCHQGKLSVIDDYDSTDWNIKITAQTMKRRQGHPMTVFSEISVWRSKYCLEFFITWGRLKISWWPFHSCTIFQAYVINPLRFC